MFLVEEYYEAQTLDEALLLMADKPERQIIAGGTDLLIKMREDPVKSVQLISIRSLEALKTISLLDDKTLSIGPLATFYDLATDPLIRGQLPILVEAALTVGGPQLRAMATIGGNICNGAPSADSAPVLFALDARLRLQSKDQTRIIPIQEFYRGPGLVDLKPGELLTAITIAEESYRGQGGSYIKFAPRKAMDLAMIGVAVTCRLAQRQHFEEVRISLGVAAPTPIRCIRAEKFARKKAVTEEVMAEAGRLALAEASPRSSWRASREYREHLIVELTARAMKTAASRAGGLEND